MIYFFNRFSTSFNIFTGKFQSKHGFSIQLARAPPGESQGTAAILARSLHVVVDSLERWSTRTAMPVDILLTCSTNTLASRNASNTCKHLTRIDVSSSFLQYFFSQAYMRLILSTNNITNLFLTRSGRVTNGSNNPIHSRALLLLPQSRFFESLSRVIKAGFHFKPPAKNRFSPSKPTEATPRSPGTVKFWQTPSDQL